MVLWHISVQSDLEVVGFNPENADMDRPRGEIVGEVFFLRAENERGDRRVYTQSWTNPEAAEVAIEFAPPVYLWEMGRPCFGSLAWQEYGEDDQMESERRLNEAESWGFDTRYMIA